MQRIGSKNVMVNGKNDAPKKKGITDWAQKRASQLILAPQPRLTEFKPMVYTATGAEAVVEDPDRQREDIASSSLSDLIPHNIQRHLLDPTKVVETPYIVTMQASCLFLDISQFTTISELLASDGGLRGPELLARSINKLFTQLVRLVQRSGGDIFKFAGDAVIVLWPVNEAEGETLEMAAHRAVQCAVDVQKTVPELKLDEFRSEKNKKADLSFAFKCGVGVGTVSVVHLGGGRLAYGAFAGEYEEGRTSTKRVLDPRTQTATSTGAAIAGRREYVALGDPLKQAFAAEKHANRHDIVVSRQTWTLVSDKFKQRAAKNPKSMDGFVLIGEQIQLIKKKRQLEAALPQKEWMLTYVPRSAHLFLEVEHHTHKDWVSELRRVTVLFINLGVPQEKLQAMLTRHEGIETLHEYFSCVQSAVMDYEGSVNKFLMDDKGSTVIAVFGLPPISHENDATRGVLASLAISTSLQALGADPAVGVATGIAFCGVVGHPGGRREYTVLGDIVNLSARLMQRAAEKQEGVLCDKETFYQAQEHLDFNFLKPVQVKGKAKKVDVYQPHQKGFKTKRTLLAKALGVRKHRRRRSLDTDWREQVMQFNKRNHMEMLEEEVEEFKDLMFEVRRTGRQSRDGPAMSVSSSKANQDFRPKSAISDGKMTKTDYERHEDERNLKSDQFDDLMFVLSDIHEAMVGESICPVVLEGSIGMGKSHLLSRVSSILRTEKDLYVLGAACNPFERGALARPFGIFITLISLAIWHGYTEEQARKGGDAALNDQSTIDDVPISFRRMIILRWLSNSQNPTSERTITGTKYLLNDDFGVDFDEPHEEIERRKLHEEMRAQNEAPPIDMERNAQLIQQKADLLCAIFEGMATEHRIACIVDDVLHMDSSSWYVARRLGAFGPEFGKGLGIVLATRPITDFVLIDAHSRDAYTSFKKLPGVKQLQMPRLPPRFVRLLAKELMRVDVIGPDIEVALEKAQGNPLFVRELVSSMLETPDVLDIDQKNKVAVFGKAAQMKLHNKQEYPMCESCEKRFRSSRDKLHCRMCGQVVCAECAPASNKRIALGYKEPVRCCNECVHDESRRLRKVGEAIEGMQLEPPVAVVCVIGTWIDKLTTKQQMVLKIACLLRDGLRFNKLQAFEAYPLSNVSTSFEHEFDVLVQLGFVREVINEERDGPRGIFAAGDDDDEMYEFCHNFLPDVLNQRVLESQREDLEKYVNDARLKREKKDREEFKKLKGSKLAQMKLKEGYLLVHKTHLNANRNPWKTRWAVIVGNRLEFYYDRSQKTPASACDLRNAKIFLEKKELSGRKRVIRISVPSWEKRGKPVDEKRDFFVSPELSTDKERDQWVNFLNVPIEREADERERDNIKNRGKRGTSVTGWIRNNILGTPTASSTPVAQDFRTGGEITSVPRKSRGLELILGRKKTSSSLGQDPATLPPPPPALAAYQEE